MVNRSKAKGTAWETAVTRWFRDNGWPHAERMPLHGAADKGDINLGPGVVTECKHHKTFDLAAWMDEVDAEMHNSGADIGACVVRRPRRTDPGDAYVVLPLRVYALLLREAGRGTPYP